MSAAATADPALRIRAATKADFDQIVAVLDRWWGGPSPERGRFGGKPFGAKPFGPKPSFGQKPFAARAAQGDAPRNPFDRPAGDRRPHDSAGPRKSGFKPHPVGGRPSRFER